MSEFINLKLLAAASLLSISCSMAQAGSPQQQWITSGTYLGVFAGYAAVNWPDFDNSPFVSYRENADGGFVYGASVGYRFYRWFALEGGWMHLPTVQGDGRTNADLSQPVAAISVASWYGYVEGKLLWPVYPHVFVSVGTGLAYREIDATPSELFTNAVSYYYTPIITAGVQWDFAQDWFVYLQYTYLPGFDETLAAQPADSFDVPDANLIGLGVAYKFSI